VCYLINVLNCLEIAFVSCRFVRIFGFWGFAPGSHPGSVPRPRWATSIPIRPLVRTLRPNPGFLATPLHNLCHCEWRRCRRIMLSAAASYAVCRFSFCRVLACVKSGPTCITLDDTIWDDVPRPIRIFIRLHSHACSSKFY